MGKFIDLTGMKFGRLTAISYTPGSIKNPAKWLCKCDCGKTTKALTASLNNGGTKSCGCLVSEHISRISTTHGKSKTPEYETWCKMRSRCYRVNNIGYKDYGAKGVIVCDRWLGPEGFANFLSDMGPKPSLAHTLDRNNPHGIYEPNNCSWELPLTQARNKKNTVRVKFNGIEKPLTEWCERLRLNYGAMRKKRMRSKREYQDIFNEYAPKNTFISHSFGHLV